MFEFAILDSRVAIVPQLTSITKSKQEPNGIKLAPECLLERLLTQFLPGFHHQREAFGAPLLDPRFHPMRADGVHEQGP
jgi:hypothetical protein